MRARPSAPNTPRSSRSYKRGRGVFSFDDEHTAAAPSESSSSGDLHDATSKATRNWTPRKSNRILSPLQNLTPTRLSRALGNIGIATTPSSRSRAGDQGRPSSFLASPQSSFALSSATMPPTTTTTTWRRRHYYFVILVIAISVVVVLRNDEPIDDASTPVATTKTIVSATSGGDTHGDSSGKKPMLRGDQQSRDVSDIAFGEQEELSAHDRLDTQRKRLEDGAETISQPNLIDDENSGTTTSTENIFNRMLQIARKNKELCGEKRLGQEHRQSQQLQEFGIITDIESYLNGTESQTGARPTSKCAHLPPPTSCGARNFTVVIDASLQSGGFAIDPRRRSSHHRAIFILALRMQSVPSASEVIIQYGGSVSDLEWDRKYGRRLLMWNDDSKVAIKIVFVGENEANDLSEISNEAVMYVSAALNRADLNAISAGGLEFGFNMWKQYSDALLIASNGALVRRDNPIDVQELEASVFHEECPLETGTGGENVPQLPFFFNRNYECLLDHEVFKSLRQVVPAPYYILSVVGRASASPPRLFPGLLYKMRPTPAHQNTTGDERIIVQDEAASAVDLDMRRSSTEDVGLFFGSSLLPVHWCNDALFCQNQFVSMDRPAEKIQLGLGKNRCSALQEETFY